MRRRFRLRLGSLVIGLGTAVVAPELFPGSALGMFIEPTLAPVDRLIANIGAQLEKDPKDAEAHYRLARVHSLAFSHNAQSLRVYEGGRGLSPAKDARQATGQKALPEGERLDHLAKGVEHFNRAIKLAPGRADFRLGLASLLETSREFAGKCGVNPSPPTRELDDGGRKQYADQLKDLGTGGRGLSRFRDQLGVSCERGTYSSQRAVVGFLLEHRDDPDPARRGAVVALLREDWDMQTGLLYFQAFSRGLDGDVGGATQPMRGVGELVSFEAATAYVRMVEKREATECDRVRIATARAAIEAFKELPPSNSVTPIIFPVDSDRPLASLLDESARVRFNLDGTGRGRTWPWVRPTTGVLVWDPHGSGRIASGRQLFGSVSWWVFFKNGYQALDALDDNRDGVLSGAELTGIGVWIDRNSNGVSDAGEVVGAGSFGIASISCRATSMEDGCPADHMGMVMSDGRVLPSYDWVATPCRPRPDRLGMVWRMGAVALPVGGLFIRRERRRR